MITLERSYLFIDNKSQIKIKEIEKIYFLHFVKEDVQVLLDLFFSTCAQENI